MCVRVCVRYFYSFGTAFSTKPFTFNANRTNILRVSRSVGRCVFRCFWFVLFAFHSLYARFDWNVRNRIRIGRNFLVDISWNETILVSHVHIRLRTVTDLWTTPFLFGAQNESDGYKHFFFFFLEIRIVMCRSLAMFLCVRTGVRGGDISHNTADKVW